MKREPQIDNNIPNRDVTYLVENIRKASFYNPKVATIFYNRIKSEDAPWTYDLSVQEVEQAMFLAARFIYRCGKAYLREEHILTNIRTVESIILGFKSPEVDTSEVIECHERFRIKMNNRYYELSRHFARLIKQASASEWIFLSEMPDLGCRRDEKKYEGFKSKKARVFDFLKIEYSQFFNIKKDKTGKIIFNDSIIRDEIEYGGDLYVDGWATMDKLSPKEMERFFKAKKYLDEMELYKYYRELYDEEQLHPDPKAISLSLF